MYFAEKIKNILKKQDVSNDVSRKFIIFYQFLIVTLVAAGILFSWIGIAKENKAIEKKMLNHAKILKNIMKNEVNQIGHQLTYASSNISLGDSSPRRIRKLLSSLSLKSNNNIALSWDSYSWVDKWDRISIDGNIGFVKNPPQVSERDYLRFTKYERDKIFIGQPIYGALSKRYIIPIAIGTFSRYNKYLGTLVFGIDIDKIRDKLKSELSNKDVGFVVFKEDKMLFHSQNIDRSLIKDIENKTKLLSLEDGEIERKITSQGLFFGDDFTSVFKKDANHPIEIAIIFDSQCYRDIMIKLIAEKMLVVALIALLFLILFKILYLRIIQPVSDLSEYAKQIAKKNFNIKLQKSGNKELSEIYNSLELIKDLFAKEESIKKQMIDINKKLTDENASKNQFFQAICQDLRSPIFAISNEVKSLDNKEVVENINENIQDMLLLTEDLLDISRSSTGLINIERETPIDISKIIDKSIKICSNLAKKNSVKIQYSSDHKKKPKKIKLDKKRMRQILVSLLIKMTLSSKKEALIDIRIEDFIVNNQEKLRIFIKSNSDCSSLEWSDSFNTDLSNVGSLVRMMGGEFKIEKKPQEWCLIRMTFGY